MVRSWSAQRDWQSDKLFRRSSHFWVSSAFLESSISTICFKCMILDSFFSISASCSWTKASYSSQILRYSSSFFWNSFKVETSSSFKFSGCCCCCCPLLLDNDDAGDRFPLCLFFRSTDITLSGEATIEPQLKCPQELERLWCPVDSESSESDQVIPLARDREDQASLLDFDLKLKNSLLKPFFFVSCGFRKMDAVFWVATLSCCCCCCWTATFV
mmetsp:Transcript_27396/g.66514  ORF Transcript_27396/g.66514 Transcript_27396/m.66514 type:complete len:215 (-) Transcript_27396:15-659(-)